MRRKQFLALSKLILTPDEWSAVLGVRVVDPDGWRGHNGRDWTDPISLREFVKRCWPSTVGSEDGSTDLLDAGNYLAEEDFTSGR